MPPTLQTLTYSTGAAFLVGRSAAWALATATMPAAEPRSKLLMSVMFDLQLDMVGVGFLLTLRRFRPERGPKTDRRWAAPSSHLTWIMALCPCKMPPTLRDRESLPITRDRIASLNLDTIIFLRKPDFERRFLGDVA